MHKLTRLFKIEKNKTRLPVILSVLAIILYLVQAAYYMHHIQPVMDESTYLLKGKWFIDGTYQPFQEYGPITNKPPLSFISLGISQIFRRLSSRTENQTLLELSGAPLPQRPY
jgi:hypothetical protein